MRAINRRVHRLEEQLRPPVAERRPRIQLGNLKTLPRDYTGPRHTVATRQVPQVANGREWFEWEERHGPEPRSAAHDANDEDVIRVCFVEAKDGKPAQ
jgi:hypothetical protein